MKWTALLKETPSSINPTQFRPTSIGSSSKARYYRTQGLADKFTRKSDLITFQREVMEHLEENGMDSISYLPSPVDPDKMVSIVSDHGRYTLKQAREAEKAQMALYDTYDHNNMKDAKKFLLASISNKLKTQLHEDCYPDDSFIVMWMCLMRRIGSISISKYDQVKNRIKGRRLNQYAAQNVESMCSDLLSDYKELHGASMYDHTLTSIMLDNFMEGTDEDFKCELRPVKKKLDKKL